MRITDQRLITRQAFSFVTHCLLLFTSETSETGAHFIRQYAAIGDIKRELCPTSTYVWRQGKKCNCQFEFLSRRTRTCGDSKWREKTSDAPMRRRSTTRLCLPAAGGVRADRHFIQYVWPRSPDKVRTKDFGKTWRIPSKSSLILVEIFFRVPFRNDLFLEWCIPCPKTSDL